MGGPVYRRMPVHTKSLLTKLGTWTVKENPHSYGRTCKFKILYTLSAGGVRQLLLVIIAIVLTDLIIYFVLCLLVKKIRFEFISVLQRMRFDYSILLNNCFLSWLVETEGSSCFRESNSSFVCFSFIHPHPTYLHNDKLNVTMITAITSLT